MKLTINTIKILQRLNNQEDTCDNISLQDLESLKKAGLIQYIFTDNKGLIWRIVTTEGKQKINTLNTIMNTAANTAQDCIKSEKNKLFYSTEMKSRKNWQDNILMYIFVGVIIGLSVVLIQKYIL